MNIEMEKKEHEQKMQAAIATRKSYDDYGNRGRDNKRNREYFIVIANLHDYLNYRGEYNEVFQNDELSLIFSLSVRMLNTM